MNRTLILAILMAGCGATQPTPVQTTTDLKAGKGIRIEAETISVDDSVPTPASCAAGQVLQRTSSGWACAAAVSDSDMLGGQPASAYMTQQMTAKNSAALDGHDSLYFLNVGSTAANSAKLEGHPAADFLGSHATAVNAALLEGHPASDFLPAGGTAVNSATLNGHPDTDFLAAGGTAVNAAGLNGHPGSYYLPATATAADSAKLAGQPPSYYLAATATAADSAKLGSVAAGNYARLDVANTMRGPLSLRDVKDASWYGTVFAGTLTGGDSSGNVHIYGDDAGVDGRVYLNWFGGNGVRFGNGARSQVAEVDGSGNVTAASYNGIQLSVVTAAANLTGCKDTCATTNASCVAAQQLKPFTTTYVPALCSDTFLGGFSMKCVCVKF